jgi:hypothetical protein
MVLFNTVGMSAAAMPGGGGRLELIFAVRTRPSPEDRLSVCRHLVALADFPWRHGTRFGDGHIVPLGADFPMFRGCRAVLLATPSAHVELPASAAGITALQVLPLTTDEAAAMTGRTTRSALTVLAGRDPLLPPATTTTTTTTT